MSRALLALTLGQTLTLIEVYDQGQSLTPGRDLLPGIGPEYFD